MPSLPDYLLTYSGQISVDIASAVNWKVVGAGVAEAEFN
jgi:hypothetical protein